MDMVVSFLTPLRKGLATFRELRKLKSYELDLLKLIKTQEKIYFCQASWMKSYGNLCFVLIYNHACKTQ